MTTAFPRARDPVACKGERSMFTHVLEGAFAEIENLRMMDPLVFPGTIEDDEEVEVEESDSDEEEVLNFEALPFI